MTKVCNCIATMPLHCLKKQLAQSDSDVMLNLPFVFQANTGQLVERIKIKVYQRGYLGLVYFKYHTINNV